SAATIRTVHSIASRRLRAALSTGGGSGGISIGGDSVSVTRAQLGMRSGSRGFPSSQVPRDTEGSGTVPVPRCGIRFLIPPQDASRGGRAPIAVAPRIHDLRGGVGGAHG